MKQEDKELLLQDLCGRIPYGVKLNMKGLIGVSHHTTILYGKNTEMYFRYGCNDYFINEVKPYLFPLSSMTEKQKTSHNFLKYSAHANPIKLIDWYNKNHFDYRGLISKGLAIDCTNLNIY
jgi:hypothetical protein